MFSEGRLCSLRPSNLDPVEGDGPWVVTFGGVKKLVFFRLDPQNLPEMTGQSTSTLT